MVTRFVGESSVLEKGFRTLREDKTFLHGSSSYERIYHMFPVEGTRFRVEALDELVANPYYRIGTTDIPAGLTYLGQFIAHDITHLNISITVPGVLSLPIGEIDQLATPSLDLGGLYGDVESFGHHMPNKDERFISQFNHEFNGRQVIYDIPRAESLPHVSYLIGDARNDENLITAQMHVLFMNFHNRLVDIHQRQLGRSVQDAFTYARKEATLLFQHVVVNDFLSSFLEAKVYENLFRDKNFKRLLNVSKGEEPRVSAEFSGAAFRFGHSLVRPDYIVNERTSVNIKDMFRLTGKGGDWAEIKSGDFVLEWPFLLDMSSYGFTQKAVTTMPIDPTLAEGLRSMKNENVDNQDLSRRNQYRGSELNLPCGQEIVKYLKKTETAYANKMGLELIDPSRIDTAAVFLGNHFLSCVKKWGLAEKMPLWQYILTEPHFLGGGQQHRRLGVLGSIIVGEIFRNLLEGSRTSIYSDTLLPGDSAFMYYMKSEKKNTSEELKFENAKLADIAFFTYYLDQK